MWDTQGIFEKYVRLNSVSLCQTTELLKAFNMHAPLVIVHEKEYAACCNLTGCVDCFLCIHCQDQCSMGPTLGKTKNCRRMGEKKMDKRQRHFHSGENPHGQNMLNFISSRKCKSNPQRDWQKLSPNIPSVEEKLGRQEGESCWRECKLM